MDFQRALDDYVDSQEFLTSQFKLEQNILQQIKNQCFKFENDREFTTCKKTFTKYRKSFRYFYQNYTENLQKEQSELMNKQCLKFDNKEEYVDCISEVGSQFAKDNVQKEKDFLNSVRIQIQQDIMNIQIK